MLICKVGDKVVVESPPFSRSGKPNRRVAVVVEQTPKLLRVKTTGSGFPFHAFHKDTGKEYPSGNDTLRVVSAKEIADLEAEYQKRQAEQEARRKAKEAEDAKPENVLACQISSAFEYHPERVAKLTLAQLQQIHDWLYPEK